MNVDPRSITDAERPHLQRLAADQSFEAQWTFRLRLESEVDATPTMAASVTAWLVDKLNGRPDRVSAPTRSRYRKLLKRLPTEPGPRSRRSLRLVPPVAAEASGPTDEIANRRGALVSAVLAA